jgi:hypothetical protein
MRSLLGRFHRPNARSQTERLFMLNNLGDGSTLSLDFTTGILDPRITFTRSTNATFINSQGYVQFAAANMFVNSAWTDANNLPAGWTLGAGTGSVSRSNETRTLTCAAQQYWWYQQPASRSGLTYSVSVEVTAVSGSMVYGDIILAGSSTYIAWYKDGVLQASGTSTTVTTGVITLIFTANSDNTILRLGLGSAGTNVTGSVTLRYPQFQQGQVPLRSYYENTSTSVARFNSARFDYDPTALTAKGLLIEGSATNLAVRSDDFNTTVTDGTQWIASTYTAGTLSTTLPDGTTGNARRISIASGSGSLRSSTITVTASTAYTFSFWARNNGGSQARFRVWNVTAGSSIVDYTQSVNNYVSQIGGANNTSSTWVRVSVPFTTPAGCTAIYVYPCSSDSGTVDLLIWGAQVEAAGASSYIPTGASTGNRAADSCVMTGSNFSSWFNATEGTLLAHAIRSRTSDIGRIASVNDNTANESIELGADTTGEFIVVDGGSTLATISPGTVTANTAFKIAGAYKLNDVQAALGGTLGTADTSVTLPTVDRLMIGQQAGGSPVYLNGTISLLKYWPTRLTNAQLQSLTT